MCRVLVLIAGVASMTPGIAQATVYTFEPAPEDMWDFTEWCYYSWGIDWIIPASERLSSVTLTFINIESVTNVTIGRVGQDPLYIHLLDDPASGAMLAGWDTVSAGDAYDGQGLSLPTYTDNELWPHPSRDYSYTFEVSEVETLADYADNGVFGFGFDPDGHYYNEGIRLAITTEPVPEPCMTMLTIIGLHLMGRTRLRYRTESLSR